METTWSLTKAIMNAEHFTVSIQLLVGMCIHDVYVGK